MERETEQLNAYFDSIGPDKDLVERLKQPKPPKMRPVYRFALPIAAACLALVVVTTQLRPAPDNVALPAEEMLQPESLPEPTAVASPPAYSANPTLPPTQPAVTPPETPEFSEGEARLSVPESVVPAAAEGTYQNTDGKDLITLTDGENSVTVDVTDLLWDGRYTGTHQVGDETVTVELEVYEDGQYDLRVY